MRFWQAEFLKMLVLCAAVLAVGGAVALLVIGVLAYGYGPSGIGGVILLVLVIGHCFSQIWLGIAGCRSALRWISRRQIEPTPE